MNDARITEKNIVALSSDLEYSMKKIYENLAELMKDLIEANDEERQKIIYHVRLVQDRLDLALHRTKTAENLSIQLGVRK